MTDEQYFACLRAANDWRYLTILLSRGMTREEELAWSRKTTKGDLDAWLMDTFGVDEMMARAISNSSMDYETPFRRGMEGVRWAASRPEPTFEQYPTITRDAPWHRRR